MGVAAALPRRAFGFAVATFYEWKEVRPGFFVALNPTGDDMMLVGGNATLVTGKQFRNVDATLIDSKQAVLGPSLRREALIKTGAITQVINTHHHFDHAGGNAAFAMPTGDAAEAAGPRLLAHARCRERMTAGLASYTAQFEQKVAALEALDAPGARDAAADATAFRKRLADLKPGAFIPEGLDTTKVKEIASRKAEVHHVGAGHTDNDLFLFFPDDNVLVAGDLVFNKLHPYYDASAGANSQGWLRSLGRVVTLCNEETVVVPGHGGIGTLETVRTQIRYLEDARAMVDKALKEKKPREEVAKMMPTGYPDYLLKAAVPLLMGGLFDEMSVGAGSPVEPKK